MPPRVRGSTRRTNRNLQIRLVVTKIDLHLLNKMGGEQNTIYGFIYKNKIYVCGQHRSGRIECIGSALLCEVIETLKDGSYSTLKTQAEKFMYYDTTDDLRYDELSDSLNNYELAADLDADLDAEENELKNTEFKTTAKSRYHGFTDLDEYRMICDNYKRSYNKSDYYGTIVQSLKAGGRVWHDLWDLSLSEVSEYTSTENLGDRMKDKYIDYGYFLNLDTDEFQCITSYYFNFCIKLDDMAKLEKTLERWSTFHESNNH